MLEIKNIYFDYAHNESFSVCIESLCIKPKYITCILGENGSGKTTILNLIGGHIIPKKGEIILSGVNITYSKAEERPTSTVFQQIGLFPHLTIKKNIETAIQPNTIFRIDEETKKKADQVLMDFSLTDLANRKPNHLSIGQQQRAAIARALSSSPKVLLLDEPTSALDFANINNLKKTLAFIKNNSIVPIIIVVSHDLPFVLNIADEIKYIERGQLVFEGTPEEFQSSQWYVN